ncbi:hypothetical protein JANAI62_04830 [Jannaschia pagri]|uniref:SCP domain-containing protein n=1 Tax=Jannaschia pagri TaxID=2829797 RepID=A0ABQ4NHI1_9RHOB|nr:MULTISPECIES: CAP domain-containing protein [unclassified Jannaschia]GIT90034.1 hypothetical protein JANAI61_04920 [Jannaschia sp. AI_61]GIT93860.1 hypothetical protein JANAI62_04830 [Jannaschia sp. AI_62]
MLRFVFFLFVTLAAPAKADPLAFASQARVQAGLPPLRIAPALAQAAQVQANHMARVRRAGHDGPGGSRLVDRLRAAGFAGCYVAENVAAGQRTGRAVVRAWMTSPPHRANILDPTLSHGAVARAEGRGGPYWAMVLGGPC